MGRATALYLLRSQSRSFTAVLPPCPHPLSAINSTMQFASTQRRWASLPAATEYDNKMSFGLCKGGEDGNFEKDKEVVYYGPKSNLFKKLNFFTLTNCCISVPLVPAIYLLTSPGMSAILKGALASSLLVTSASTAATLRRFASPYVHKLKWQPGSDRFEVKMMSWFGTYKTETIKFSDITLTDSNTYFWSFKANGNFYFVETRHIHNEALSAKLTP